MGRLTIFAKGNLDVRDSLHALRLGDRRLWNGVNEVLRETHPGVVARVRHETWDRSDQLLASDGAIPAALAGRELSLGAFPVGSQYSRALFDTEADVYVLSVQPDANTNLARHKTGGFLFHPHNWWTWPAADQAWLREAFVDVGLLDVATSMANLAQVIDRLRAARDSAVLIYNLSSVTPGEQVHDYLGLEELFSTRIKRFNLGLIELSQQTGVSIIDVDRIIARGGADRMKYDSIHLTGEGCRAVAEEVVRVLDDLGLLGETAR